MPNQEVEDRVKRVITEQLGVKPEKVTLEAKFVEDLKADSLDHVEVCMALEEEFELTIPTEEWGKVATVQQAIDLVKKMINTGAVPVN